MIRVGSKVKLTSDVYEEPTGDSPGGYCGYRGEIVEVVRVSDLTHWPYGVRHEGREGSFGVSADEIKEV